MASSASSTATASATDIAAAAPSGAAPASAAHSRFVQRIRRRYAAELPLLAAGFPTRAVIDALIDRLLTGRSPARCA